jgi:hypothetical protein
MATQLTTFAPSEIRVIRKEVLLTEGLNLKEAAVTPRGTYRGFRLAVHPNPLNITVIPDPGKTDDHVAVYETESGYSLRLRRTGGSFSLDLSSKVSTTVIIAIYANYTTGTITSAEIRAYELSPVDEYTSAPEVEDLVVLGTVVVPASGVIPAADITHSRRVMAWENAAVETKEWVQFIENGSFQTAKVGTITPAAGSVTVEEAVPGWDTFSGCFSYGGLALSISTAQARTGTKSLRFALSGALAQQGLIRYAGVAQVRPGQLVKASVWVKGVSLNPGPVAAPGQLGLYLHFSKEDGTAAGTVYISDPSLTGSFGWTEITNIITVPALAVAVDVSVYYNDDNNSSTGDLYFDDVRLWLEVLPPSEDGTEEDKVHQGSNRLRVLDIVPEFRGSVFEDFIERMIRLRITGYSSSLNHLLMSCRDAVTAFDLRTLHGGLKVDRDILGLGTDLIGSGVDGALARVQSLTPAAATAKYVLLWEAADQASRGSLRMYASSEALGGYEALVVTVNGVWSGSQWSRDRSAVSSRFDFHGNGFTFYTYESASPSPWNDTDWDDGTNGNDFLKWWRASSKYSTVQLKGNLNFTGLDDSAEAAATARISSLIPAAATGKYCLLWEVANAGSGGNLRIYATDSNVEARNALIVTSNAEWQHTTSKWDYDSGTDLAARMDFSASRVRYYSRSGSGAAWDDGDWNDGTTGINLLDFNRLASDQFKMSLVGNILLSGIVANDSDADDARIGTQSVGTAESTSPAYTLIWENVPATGTAIAQRLYVTHESVLDVTTPALVFTVNARFSNAVGFKQWYADGVTPPTSMMVRISASTFKVLHRPATLASPWDDTDWDEEGQQIKSLSEADDDGNQGVSLSFNGARIVLGDENYSNPLCPDSGGTEVPLANTLYAKNIVKAWAVIETGGVDPVILSGFGVADVSYIGIDRLEVQLENVMDPEQGTGASTDWTAFATVDPSTGAWRSATAEPINNALAVLRGYYETGGVVTILPDITANTYVFFFCALGEQ